MMKNDVDQSHVSTQYQENNPAQQTTGVLSNHYQQQLQQQQSQHWLKQQAVTFNNIATIDGPVVQPPAPYVESYRPSSSRYKKKRLKLPAKRWKRSSTLRVAMQMHQRRERWKRTQSDAGHLWSSILLALWILCMIGSFSGTVYGFTYYQSQLQKLQQVDHRVISQTTRIDDRNLTPLFEVYDNREGGGRRTPVTYNEIPQVMRDALIAAEDHSFWTNSGIDPQGIVRSGLEFLEHSMVLGGGSTITQQVIKNLTGNDALTLNRKIGEAALAIGLTQHYPKWKIMEMYFNVAPFGSMDIGVEAATKEYFHLLPNCDQDFKCIPGVAQLDLNQQTRQHDPLLALARASLLAGMPQKPVTDNPTIDATHKQSALVRQIDVLNQMITLHMLVAGLGRITPALARQAEILTAKMQFVPYQRIKRAPHFVDWIINKLETALGNGDPNQGVIPFITGGFNIRTTIDVNLEDYVEHAVQRHLTQPEFQMYTNDDGPLNTEHNVNDAAVVVMNAKTGEILAMDGSANYDSTDPSIGGEYNVADPPQGIDGTPSGRGPGSSFKPIVYATAFQMGWYPGMVLPDFKTYFPNGSPATTLAKSMYTPPDYSRTGDPEYHHNTPSTIREAIANSYNVPAIKAMEYAGPQNVLVTAKRMGITTLQNNGIAWGLGSQNVPLIQMVGAYQVFANAGMRVPPQGILNIWDNYGHDLYHYDPQHPPATEVLSPQVSYLMTSVLIDEPARRLEFPGDHDLSFTDHDPSCAYNPACPYQVAAKTGTTDNYVDNLTIGYTPNVVVGVWAGNANNSPMRNVTGITGAAPIWHSVIEFAGMGWCNTATDQIACPPINRRNWHFAPQNTFPVPSGVYRRLPPGPDGDRLDWTIDG
ncbi:MAG TPA: transglycosylase domain-containing protein [Ktedonobacteraceae bacterium]|jgi:membrane peptidoglycan carboxypeptidase